MGHLAFCSVVVMILLGASEPPTEARTVSNGRETQEIQNRPVKAGIPGAVPVAVLNLPVSKPILGQTNTGFRTRQLQEAIMAQTLNTFTFEGHAVRTVNKDGEAWFVASDVARTLGYARPDGAIRRYCKGPSETEAPSAGGTQTMKIIREGDVFRLILRSKLPAAQAFEAWVMDEVLPAIRKTGQFQVPAQPEPQALFTEDAYPYQQPPAAKLEQARACAKGTYELIKKEVLPLLKAEHASPDVAALQAQVAELRAILESRTVKIGPRGEGDPPRTRLRENAAVWLTLNSAKRHLRRAQKYRPFEGAIIETIDF